jgi:glyceraldehyde 3-phosphate dehydrogenase
MAVRVGINGFGRIGRLVLRAALKRPKGNLEFVAVNDITDTATLAHLFKYDTVHRTYAGTVSAGGDHLVIDGRKIAVLAERDPAKLPWKDLGVSMVLESSGKFRDKEKAGAHFTAGAKKVVISAPGKGEDLTVVMGVNHDRYDPAKHHLLSNASCTTNCLVPVVKVVRDQFGWVRGYMITVHSYTNDQSVLDQPHKDLRRARAAALNIIPTTTGAAKATALVIPEVKGKIDGMSLRVPTADVSSVNLVVQVEKATTAAEVNEAFKRAAAAGPLKGILDVCEAPLVSCDFIGNPFSSIVDLPSTTVVDGTMLQVAAWYDNEWGYSERCVDLLEYLAARL